MASFGQLSPPFQLPQPVGGVAGFSEGMEVGMIGGGTLGETDPEPGVEVVVTGRELVVVMEDTDV